MVSEAYETNNSVILHNRLNPCFSGGWSRSIFNTDFVTLDRIVLILVLVEDGLGVSINCFRIYYFEVLILVLVEDGLGASAETLKGRRMTWS